jgi:flagellar protein FlaG
VVRSPTGQTTAAGAQAAQATAVESPKAVKRTEDAAALEQVNQAVKNINKSLQTLSQNLEFSVDSDSQRTVVKVIDQKTKEVIRQIPSEEALEIAKTLDTVKGLLIKQEA